jgi:HAD superfamily hydrolase (TIGR01490 family)
MIIALFDSDGTLYSPQFGRGMMEYAKSHGRSFDANAYYASLVPEVLLAKIKMGNPERFQRGLIERLTWLFKGYTMEEANRAFEWVIDEYLLKQRRTDVIERLQSHQSQGHEVLVVSGMFAPALKILCDRLGVRHFVGTQLEVSHDRYTGRIIPPIIKGKDKVEKAREYLVSKNLDIDWESSYAYGDSYTDRDMLEIARHAVAVYPDEKLNSLAKEQNWEILGAPK